MNIDKEIEKELERAFGSAWRSKAVGDVPKRLTKLFNKQNKKYIKRVVGEIEKIEGFELLTGAVNKVQVIYKDQAIKSIKNI